MPWRGLMDNLRAHWIDNRRLSRIVSDQQAQANMEWRLRDQERRLLALQAEVLVMRHEIERMGNESG